MKQISPPLRLSAVVLVALAATGTACTNDGSDLGPSPLGERLVTVGVYLDRDGSRTVTPLDTVFAKARVALLIRGSTDTFKVATAGTDGIARFPAVPLGQYSVAVDPKSIGDSIQVQAIDSSDVTVTAQDSAVSSVARLGYPEVSIRQARGLPAGRRVFLRGIILSGVQSFRDTTSHLADSSGSLRLTRVALRAGSPETRRATASRSSASRRAGPDSPRSTSPPSPGSVPGRRRFHCRSGPARRQPPAMGPSTLRWSRSPAP